MQINPNKTPAAIKRAAKRLARKRVARTIRELRKQDAAMRIPFAGVEGELQPWSWDKLLSTAVSRPLTVWPAWLVKMTQRLSRRNEYAKAR